MLEQSKSRICSGNSLNINDDSGDKLIHSLISYSNLLQVGRAARSEAEGGEGEGDGARGVQRRADRGRGRIPHVHGE